MNVGFLKSRGFKVLSSAALFILTLFFSAKFFKQMSGGDFYHVFGLYSSIPTFSWIVISFLALAFYLLDWFRYSTLLSLFQYRLSPVTGFQLTSVSYLVSSLTPVAELHLPTMVYLLRKRGIPIADAISCTVAKGIYLTFWICVMSLVSLLFDRNLALPDWLHTSFPLLVAPFAGICCLLSALVFFPNQIHHWIKKKSSQWDPKSIQLKVLRGLDNTAQSISKIGRSRHHSHFFAHLGALAFIFVYIGVGYTFSHALGLPITPFRAITVFSTSLLIAYLSPVPGSIGVAELATSYMLDPQLTATGMAISLGLRIVCWYMVAPIGLVSLIFELWHLPKSKNARG